MEEEEEEEYQKPFSLVDFFKNSPLTQLIVYLILVMFIFIVYIAHAVGLVFSLKCEHYSWFLLNFVLGLFCIPSGAFYFYFHYDPTTCLIPLY